MCTWGALGRVWPGLEGVLEGGCCAGVRSRIETSLKRGEKWGGVEEKDQLENDWRNERLLREAAKLTGGIG